MATSEEASVTEFDTDWSSSSTVDFLSSNALSRNDIILICGAVCSGKNTVLDEFSLNGYEPFDMGDFARMIHEEEDTDLSVSEWAGRKRDREGKEWLAEVINDYITDCQPNCKPAISGIRSIEEIDYYSNNFDRNVKTIFVWADVFERFDRAKERDRSDFKSFEEFMERDYEEWNWGLDEIYTNDLYDYFLPNMSGESELREYIRFVIGPQPEYEFPSEKPWEDTLTEEHSPFYLARPSKGDWRQE